MNGLDICAGSAIGSLVMEYTGLARTVCYVEHDDYCQRLIEQRITDGWLPDAPIWDDLRTFPAEEWSGRVDFIFGGIPCQPYSTAGKQLGESDERDLWESTRQLISTLQPRVVLLENVANLIAHRGGLRRILGGLASVGYDAEWTVISAGEAGACHERERVWIVSYPNQCGTTKRRQCTAATPQVLGRGNQHSGSDGDVEWQASLLTPREDQSLGSHPMYGGRPQRQWRVPRDEAGLAEYVTQTAGGVDTDAPRQRQQECAGAVSSTETRATDLYSTWWQSEPPMARVVDGMADWVDRVRVTGNGWVPQVAVYVALQIRDALERGNI